eukprot:m.223487 g.223487  ORF g.223487 m.223487 type:complete len:184 (-) comp22324_c0_seq1:73-624(-)
MAIQGNTPTKLTLSKKSMTARQRALVTGKPDEFSEPLLELPLRARRGENSRKRSQAEEAMIVEKRKRREREKQDAEMRSVVASLLKKQTSKKIVQDEAREKRTVTRESKMKGPHLHYQDTASGCFVACSSGLDYPIQPQKLQPPKPQQQCAAPNCSNPRKYSCARSKQPVCSLQCYKAVETLG